MTEQRAKGSAHVAAMLLSVVSVLVTVGAGVLAGVVFAQGDSSDGSGTLVRGSGTESSSEPTTETPGFDYSGWKVVTGVEGKSGYAATYRLPDKGWTTYGSDYEVSFRDKREKRLASGHALANYYGNNCTDAGEKVAGAWTVLAVTEPSGDLGAIAEVAVKRWARGYATNAKGTTAPMTEPQAQEVTLADGTKAARASITIDMSVFDGPCLPDDAEIMVTTMDTSDGAKSLVQARYLLDKKGVTDAQWEAISQSLEP